MKNWFVFLTVFLISLSLVLSIFILFFSYKPFRSIEAEAEQLALNEKLLETITDSYSYHSKVSYITVFGQDDRGKEKVVFIPATLKKKGIQQLEVSDGISRQQALDVVRNEQEVKKILHVKLGYEEAGAVWEITYTNNADNLNYVYILFEDGQWWKRILNL